MSSGGIGQVVYHISPVGYLALEFPNREFVVNIVQALQKVIRTINNRIETWENYQTGDNYQAATRMKGNFAILARASRMGYELITTNQLTDLSSEDIEVLYSIKIDTDTNPLFKVLNKTRWYIVSSGIDDIIDGNSAAKAVRTIMEG